MSTEATTHNLVFTRVFNINLEEAWKAWTEPEYVLQWWGPDLFTATLAKLDVREGGTSLVCMSAPEYGDNYSLWQYQKIVPLQQIDFIHNLADKDGNKVDPVAIGMPADFPQDQLQRVTFKALGDHQTEMVVTEYGWTEGQMMEMSKMGMEQCLDKMAVMFAKR